jgi:hypothetical protein
LVERYGDGDIPHVPARARGRRARLDSSAEGHRRLLVRLCSGECCRVLLPVEERVAGDSDDVHARRAGVGSRRTIAAGLVFIAFVVFFPWDDALRRATWTTFRRTWSTWAHEAGAPLKIMARVMGHTKVDTTINTYTQVLDDSIRTAVAPVDEKLFRIVQSRERVSGLIH